MTKIIVKPLHLAWFNKPYDWVCLVLEGLDKDKIIVDLTVSGELPEMYFEDPNLFRGKTIEIESLSSSRFNGNGVKIIDEVA